jgi:uncharacterized membrane protein YgcG
MKCPSCGSPFAAPVPECPNCSLTLQRLDAKLGAVPLHTRYVTDRSGKLPLAAVRKLRDLLQIFEMKFPQSVFSVFVTDYVPGGSISEYTFWLANRARLSPLDAVAGDNFDLLLGINLESGEAALTAGYGLENYLAENDLDSALGMAEEAFRMGDVPCGIRNCVEFMTNRLREIAKANEIQTSPPIAAVSEDY